MNSKKLKIAVWHNLPSGGGKRALYEDVKGLVEKGHHVESWCPDVADKKFISLKGLITEHIKPLNLKELQDKNSIYAIFKDFDTVNELIHVFDEFNQSCAEEINRGDFDILYAHSCFCFRTSSIANYVYLPSILNLGEPYRWYYEALPELPWLWPENNDTDGENKQILDGIRFQGRYELENAKKFDSILAYSIYSRESFLKTYNIETKVCYLGIDTNHYKSTGEKKENFVLSIGTIYHAKGVDRAIRAIGAIDKSIRPDLVWVGNGTWEEDLKFYKELSDKLNVNFIPKINVSDEEVVSLLSRAKVFLYTPRLEPFGLAPLEANACGTPVVAIAEGGIRETIINGLNGFTVNEDDPEKLAERITYFLENPEEIKKIGEKGRQYVVNNWQTKNRIDSLEKHLYDLLQTNKSLYGNKIAKCKGNFIKPTNDITLNVERFENKNDKTVLEGWAFINDGKGTKDSKIYIVLKDNKTGFIEKIIGNHYKINVFPTEMTKRPDVERDYGLDSSDNVGFKFSGIIERSNLEIGILIIRDEKISFCIL